MASKVRENAGTQETTMAKRISNEQLGTPRTTYSSDGTGAAPGGQPDFLAAGAEDLRRRAAACRVDGGGSDCRKLEAAAELLDPSPVEVEEAPARTAKKGDGASPAFRKAPVRTRAVEDAEDDQDGLGVAGSDEDEA